MTARCSKVLCDNNGFDLGKDNKWSAFKASSERDIWSNNYVQAN